ncbi:MAG: hypothetical protein IPO58_06890 [Betaproteobacteria bacterium]|nr:hypothetical protein [Betaproteobacteria bacterium]
MDEIGKSTVFARADISPALELGAYEWLWLHRADSYAGIAGLFRQAAGSLPSELASEDGARAIALQAIAQLARAGVTTFGVRVRAAATTRNSCWRRKTRCPFSTTRAGGI